MAESLELWQRLGHASYRDWVLAAEKARRVAKAANKAAAKATALVQPSPTSALQPVPLPTLAPPPLHRLPYREELVATWDPSDADKPPEDRRLPKSFVSTGVCHPLSACRHGLVPSTATACSEKGAAAAREAAAAATEAEAIAAVMEAAVVELDLDAKMVWVHHLGRFESTQRAGLDPPSGPTWHVWNHHPFGHPLGPRNQEEATCQSESIERAKSQLDPNWTDSRLEDRDRLGQTASNARSAAKEAQVRAERLRDIAARQLDPLLPVPMEGHVIEGTFWSDLIQMKEWKSTIAIALFRTNISQCSARAWPSGPPLTAVVAPWAPATCAKEVFHKGRPFGSVRHAIGWLVTSAIHWRWRPRGRRRRRRASRQRNGAGWLRFGAVVRGAGTSDKRQASVWCLGVWTNRCR